MGSSLPNHWICAYSDPSTGYSQDPDCYTNHNEVCRKYHLRGVCAWVLTASLLCRTDKVQPMENNVTSVERVLSTTTA